jgi:hypothetical protein
MKSINYLVLFVFALTMSVSSCKKDSSNTLTPKEMLTAKSWKLSSYKLNGVEAMDDCLKDDIIAFAANGTYSNIVGAITCYDGEINYSGTWTLSSDGKTITLDGDPSSIEIMESKLVITQTLSGTDTVILTLIPA